MKIGVSSYSYNQRISKGEMTAMDALVAAKETGFDGIEFVDFNLPKENTAEYAVELKKRAEEIGIEICCYSVGAQLIQETEEETRAEIERVKKQIDIAAALGVKLMRHDAFFQLKKYLSFDLCLPELGEICRELSKYAEQYGIRTTIENHGYICQGSDRVEKIFNAVNYPNFGLLTDIGNFCCVDEDSAHAVAAVAPYTIHAHIKDFKIYDYADRDKAEGGFQSRACNVLVGAVAGDGDVPVAQCIDILKRVGYDDYLVLEYEGAEDCMQGVKKGFDFVSAIIK